MDHVGIDRALLVAWSLGVNVSFEIAAEHPEKVAGMLMWAGVPGGTFDAAFSNLLVPKPLRKQSGLLVSRAGQAIGGPLSALARVVPKGPAFAEVLRQRQGGPRHGQRRGHRPGGPRDHGRRR